MQFLCSGGPAGAMFLNPLKQLTFFGQAALSPSFNNQVISLIACGCTTALSLCSCSSSRLQSSELLVCRSISRNLGVWHPEQLNPTASGPTPRPGGGRGNHDLGLTFRRFIRIWLPDGDSLNFQHCWHSLGLPWQGRPAEHLAWDATSI